MIKFVLVGSHENLDALRLRLENYFYSPIELRLNDETKTIYWLYSNDKHLTGYRVIRKKNRYRFERIANVTT